MNSETRQCQNCKQEFRIDPEDFQFYEKIKVPPPTWCPECRSVRRMTAREIRTFYKDTCKLCGRSVISMHAPDGPFTIYCRECWFSDKWDPMDYGREYDFDRPFFVQYRELMEAVPRPSLTGTNMVNSEYCSGGKSCKNCYMVFLSYFTEDSQNSWGLLMSRYAYDAFLTDNSDHVYQTMHSNRLYRTSFAFFCDECLDSDWLYDCVGCSDCFGCVNLRKKKYCLFNQQLSKTDYLEQRKFWDLGSYQKLKEAKAKFRALYLAMPHRFSQVVSSQNVTGDIIREAKDCDHCFSVMDGVENCRYVYFAGLNLKDSYDVTGSGDMDQLVYEVSHTTRSQNCAFANGGGNSQNIRYSIWPDNCSDLFGCVNVKNKRYCILNKQYSEKDYKDLAGRIIDQMNELPYVDRRGRIYRYGEFFPPEFSAYPYNQSFAFDWYPRTKTEVLAEGWLWADPPARDYKITLPAADLPDHIQNAQDSLTAQVIGCENGDNETAERSGCTKAFRITPEELAFHREMSLALPRLCANCRYTERLSWRNKLDLFQRKCACGSGDSYRNNSMHFHGEKLCPNEFKTTFSPTQPEVVYCEQCFKSEFL